ncbi:MAG TPA: protein kinase [Polyangia bacterium]|jgi:serine/threonine-protein kinase|nr:protein kinase [Polyangia bacterium]
MTKESAPVKEGEILAGKYRVGRTLGQGGMGIVVAATHIQLEQRIALKLLLPSVLEYPDVVTRFTREAQAAAKIQGEHVSRVLDVGSLESGIPFMVMEYLEGEDLEQTLARRGPLPIAEAVDCVLQTCEAVAEAHALGIIHRDLKPANLFLAQRPGGKSIVKVLDFGISKTPASADNPGLTQTTSTLGSPPYMSPEQVRSTRSADARSDIWSLGVVLYELLTSRRAFNAESLPAIYVAILDQNPQPPRVYRTEIPPALDAIVMRCLQKSPALRYPDVAALAAALSPFGPPGSSQSVERIAHMLGVSPPIAAAIAVTPSGSVPAVALQETLPSPPTHVRAAPLAASPDTSPTPGRLSRMIILVAILAIGVSGTAYWLAGRNKLALLNPGASAPAAPKAIVPAEASAPGIAPTAAPQKAAAAARSTPARHPGPSSKQRERAHGSGAAVETLAPADDPRTPSPVVHAPSAPPSALCADLLERESLGETLTPAERAAYSRQCNK